MYVCVCKGITDTQIREALDSGAQSIGALKKELGVSTQCGQCTFLVRQLVDESLNASSSNTSFYRVA